MTTNQRGCRNLLFFLVFVFFGCILIPFILLPSWKQAVTLPVISVPAEPYLKGMNVLGVELVNSLGGAVVAMIIVFAIAFIARRHSKGWTKEVPGRFQALVEIIVDGLWSFTKQQAGNKPRVRNILFPLVASLFLYLLAGNWGKLIPGVETVGILHCAIYEPSPASGFPVMESSFLGRPYFIVESEQALNTGVKATADSYHSCEAFLGVTEYQDLLPTQLDPYLDERVTYTVQEGDTLANIAARFTDEVTAKTAQPLPDLSGYVDVPYESWALLAFAPEDIVAANLAEDGTLAIQYPEVHSDAPAEDAGHSKVPAFAYQVEATAEPTTEEVIPVEATTEAVIETTAEAVIEATAEAGILSDDESHSTTEEGVATGPAEATPIEVAALPEFDASEELVAGQTIVIREKLLGEKATTLQNQLYMVTPLVRGMTTDLSFTIGLALLVFFAIQFFGFAELGPNYFQKFINVHAVGNIAKNPMGGIDFVVGFFEIISELGKIISLSFRLFGAIFAGSVLFAVIMFLVGTTIPAIILLLELIVGFAQAAVFAILTLLFCSQAMVSHIHDDGDHGHAEHGEAAHH